MANIRAGTKVTCIDASGFAPVHGEVMPVLGRTYTVRELVNSSGKVCYRLKEIVNKPAIYAQGFVECSFRANRFAVRQGK